MMWPATRGVDESTARDLAQVGGATGDVLIAVGEGKLVATELQHHDDVVIGRGEDCEVVVDHRSLSRRHAILRRGPPATVQDLDSTNWTRVAGKVLRGGGPATLDPGGGFQIGPFVFMIVRRTASREASSSVHDLLRVIDPTLDGVTPLVRDIACSGANVLILGETGVGKEVLATTLHALSGRTGALTRINCAALSEGLLESELFGHAKGAFTGAATQKIGLIEAADHGTVFLDEVGELSLPIQAKLLRALEHHEVLPLGATRPVALDVRFLAATNRDLLAEVEGGAFRRDLFFRLDGVELVIPPLRERRALIAPLVRRCLQEARTRAGKPLLGLSHDALAALEAHAWPGNVRELKAVVERAVLLAEGDQIGVKHLAFSRRTSDADEAMAEQAAGQELLELALHEAWIAGSRRSSMHAFPPTRRGNVRLWR
jgi:transcriptional regulator with AAA-type ATPase domain